MSNGEFDARDMVLKRALSFLADQMATAGRSQGWQRIERALYEKRGGRGSFSRWRTALVFAVLVAALGFGFARIPAVNVWGWKVLFAARDLRGAKWQPGAALDSLLGIPFEALVVDPDSSEWVLQAISLNPGDGGGTAVALRYRDESGAVFTLWETPTAADSGIPGYDPRDPKEFLLKVGRSNIAFLVPGPGLVRASWVAEGLQVEIWGNGEAHRLVSLIRSLVPYSP